MKKKVKVTIGMGVFCLIIMLVSSWYSVTFNESRLVAPMDFSEYAFHVKDLPMICSLLFVVIYVFFLFGFLVMAIIKNKDREATASVTRAISPKLGFLGFCGFFGCLGFLTYSNDKTIFPFAFFIFFGFFGFFYEGKMSNTFMDERYKENKLKAQIKSNQVALTIIFIALILLGQGKIMNNLEYTLIIFVIIVALAIALQLFLSEYLLYRYDHDGQLDESEE
ncbi:MAG: DUF3796 domain-containing protein [Lachnospiraceae bacterium]|nr:DUF3796 domain-containing protein [Lachnospiraceae bacterium]